MGGKAIVFGGSGFLGSHVADELSSQGYDVTIFDKQPSPYLQSSQKMIVGDILDRTAVNEACEKKDYVYNYAGLADINDAKNNPLLTAQLNIIGHINILEGARLSNAKRFVYASTIYVFSESGSFYRVSKEAGEKYVELYSDKYKLEFTILRYGSLYGPRADHRNAIFRFVEGALKDSTIRYKGTGDEIREYIHVLDASKASVGILDESYRNSHITITGHQHYRVKDIMIMIAEMLADRKIKLQFENEELEAHYNVTPYAYRTRLSKKLVVNPFVDMGQGVLNCIENQDISRP
jgi:UDP-glucose 4-epimerase